MDELDNIQLQILRAFRNTQTRLPDPIANDVTTFVSGVYQAEYLKAHPEDATLAASSPREFGQKVAAWYRGTETQAKWAREKALGTPVPDWMRTADVDFGGERNENILFRFRQGLTKLQGSSTVKDLQTLLVEAATPILATQGRLSIEKGANPMEVISRGALGILERLPGYVSSQATFSLWAQWAAFGSAQDEGRKERQGTNLSTDVGEIDLGGAQTVLTPAQERELLLNPSMNKRGTITFPRILTRGGKLLDERGQVNLTYPQSTLLKPWAADYGLAPLRVTKAEQPHLIQAIQQGLDQNIKHPLGRFATQMLSEWEHVENFRRGTEDTGVRLVGPDPLAMDQLNLHKTAAGMPGVIPLPVFRTTPAGRSNLVDLGNQHASANIWGQRNKVAELSTSGGIQVSLAHAEFLALTGFASPELVAANPRLRKLLPPKGNRTDPPNIALLRQAAQGILHTFADPGRLPSYQNPAEAGSLEADAQRHLLQGAYKPEDSDDVEEYANFLGGEDEEIDDEGYSEKGYGERSPLTPAAAAVQAQSIREDAASLLNLHPNDPGNVMGLGIEMIMSSGSNKGLFKRAKQVLGKAWQRNVWGLSLGRQWQASAKAREAKAQRQQTLNLQRMAETQPGGWGVFGAQGETIFSGTRQEAAAFAKAHPGLSMHRVEGTPAIQPPIDQGLPWYSDDELKTRLASKTGRLFIDPLLSTSKETQPLEPQVSDSLSLYDQAAAARKLIEKEFPEYVRDHLGRGPENQARYEAWKDSLGERRGAFEEAHRVLMEEKRNAPTGTSVWSFWIHETGGWKGNLGSPAAKSSVQHVTSEEGQRRYEILTESAKFVKGYGRFKIAAGSREDALASYQDGMIRIHPKFFSDEELDDPKYNEMVTEGTPWEKRRAILAHEVGHGLTTQEMVDEAEGYFRRLREERPEVYSQLIERIKKADPKHPYLKPGQLAKELAADLVSGALGYTRNRVFTRFGMSPEEYEGLVEDARVSLEKHGLNRQAQSLAAQYFMSDEPPMPDMGDDEYWKAMLGAADELGATPGEPAARAQAGGGGGKQPPNRNAPPEDAPMPEEPSEDQYGRRRYKNRYQRPGVTPIAYKRLPGWIGGADKEDDRIRKWYSALGEEGARRWEETYRPLIKSSGHISLPYSEEQLHSDMPAAEKATLRYLAKTMGVSIGGFHDDPHVEGLRDTASAVMSPMNPDPVQARAGMNVAPTPRTREAAANMANQQENLQNRSDEDMARRARGEGYPWQPGQQMNFYRQLGSAINWKAAQHFENKSYGNKIVTNGIDDQGHTVPTDIRFEDANGTVNIDRKMLERGAQVGQEAWNDAFTQGGMENLSGKDLMKTVNGRINKYINSYVERTLKEGEALSNNDPGHMADLRESTRKISSLARDYVRRPGGPQEQMGGFTYNADGSSVGSSWKDTAYSNQRLYNAKSIQAEYDAPQRAGFRALIDQLGGAEAAATGPYREVTVDDIPYSFGGGGRGGGGFAQRAAGGARNIWNGNLGRAMYGAYIAKRLWGWTAGPEFAEAEWYGKEMAGIAPLAQMEAAQAGGEMNLMSSDAGYATRQLLTRQYFGKGSVQQWGGIADVGYSMTGGSEALARAKSGIGVGVGIAAAGQMIPAMMGIIPGLAGGAMAGAATAMGPIAVGAGLTMAAGTLAMEGYNALNPDQEPITWGGIARSTFARLYEQGAKGRIFQREYNAGGPTRPVAQISREEALAELNPRQAAIVAYQGETEAMKWATAQTTAVTEVTGEGQTEVQPVMRALFRGMTTKPSDAQVREWARGAAEAGYTWNEEVQQGMQLSEQFGYKPGTQGFTDFMTNWQGNMSEAERQKLISRGGVVSRYGGMLSGYYQSPHLANRMVDEAGIDTQPKAQAVQSLLAAAGQFGFDAESIVGYNASGAGGLETWGGGLQAYAGPQAITLDRVLADMAKRLGPNRSLYAAQLGQDLMEAGVPMQPALGAVETYGIKTQAQMTNVTNMLRTAQSFGFGYGSQAEPIVAAGAPLTSFQAGITQSIYQRIAQHGYGDIGALAGGVGGLSGQQASLLERYAGGDLSAASWGANTGVAGFGQGDRWNDMAGRPIYQTSGAGFFDLVRGQAARGNSIAMQFAGKFNLGGNLAVGGPGGAQAMQARDVAAATAMFNGNAAFGQAFAEGGAFGVTAVYNAQQARFQQASAGIQLQQIALQEQFLWGSGSWDNPAADSMWGLQDKARGMQHKSQMADFRANRERMEMSNRYAVAQEGITWNRMEANQDYQRWTRGFDWQGMQLSQTWAREDWQYQDTVGGLAWGWQMEDMDEAIRTSRGRQRKTAVKAKERATVGHNLEEEQKEKTRDRQETQWGREEERFNKQAQYSEKLMALDKEQFELSKKQREESYEFEAKELARQQKEYLAMKKVQDQMIDLERKHQYESLQLQKQAAGIQAAAAKATEDYNLGLLEASKTQEGMKGIQEELLKNDPTEIVNALKEMGIEMVKIKPEQVQAQVELAKEVGGVEVNKPKAVQAMLEELDGLNATIPTRLTSMATQMGKLDPQALEETQLLFYQMARVRTEIPVALKLFIEALNRSSVSKINAWIKLIEAGA